MHASVVVILLVTTMNETEAAWLAGLLEGEGSFGIQRTDSRGDYRYLQTNLTLAMTDRDIVKRAAELMCTNFYEPKNPTWGYGKKTMYRARAGDMDTVDRILVAIMPWLGNRRLERASKMLEVNALRRELGGLRVRGEDIAA